MLKIAVVDDEDTFRNKLVGYLKQYASERKNEMTVDAYADGISFLNELPRGYDVVFLDIAMPLLDGMETAKKIRKQDTEIIIVFVTTLAQYAVNGYEVAASDFLVKPIEYTLFALKADRIFRSRKVRKGEEISLKTVEEGFVRLALSDILYVESDQHYNTFYCPHGKYVVRSSMKEVEKMLINKHFCRCATSYLVNLDHVSKIYQNTVYLSSGEKLPLTRTKSQAFMNAFTIYIGGGGMIDDFFEVISLSLQQRWLFAAELSAAEILANLHLKRREGVWRIPVALVLYFLVGFFFPENIGGLQLGSRITYVVFCFSVLLNWGCFEEKLERVVYNCVGAYGLQGLVNNLSICVRQLFNVPSGWRVPVDLVACAVVYCAGYFLLFRNQEEIEGRSSNIQILLLSVVVFLATDVMAKVAASQGVGSNILLRVSLSISIVLALFFQFQVMKSSKLEQEKQKMESLLEMEQEQYRLSRETIDAVNRKCHDLKHQIRNIRKGLADEDTADALAEMERAVMFYDVIAKTGNDALDSILTEKSLVCERFHIQFHYMADGKILSFIRHVDLYALLGNALDNAIECEEQIEDVAKRMIFLNIALRGETLHIHLENYCEAQPQFKDGFPVTTKADRDSHGIGTKSIAYIVKKYGGNTVFGWESGLFRLDITVPVP